MSRVKLYPLGDKHPLQKFGPLGSIGVEGSKDIKAIASKEYREPRKGEWFLSGAIPTAYLAKHDLGTKYNIAKIVKVKTITKYIIEEIKEVETG